MTQGPFFIGRLESIRGIAALCVAVHHANAMYVVSNDDYYADLFLRIIGNGGGGIFIFFALSGYVLSLSLQRSLATGNDASVEIVAFYIRRLFRIMPLVIVAIVLGFAIKNILPLPSGGALSKFADHTLYPTSGIREFAKNLLLLTFGSNNVVWTIKIEILWSLFLPFIYLLHQHIERRMRIAILIALYLPMLFVQIGTSFLYFGAPFYLGMMMIDATPTRWPGLITLLGLFITFVIPRIDPGFDGYHVVGTALVLWGVLSARPQGAFAFLETRPARLFGRISYSFYLMHMPVMIIYTVAFVTWLPGLTGLYANMALSVISVTLTVPVAILTYTNIEVRSAEIGRLWSQYFRDFVTARMRASMNSQAQAVDGDSRAVERLDSRSP